MLSLAIFTTRLLKVTTSLRHEVYIENNQVTIYDALSIVQIRGSTQEHESLRLHELQEHANEDQAYQDLKNLIIRGFPNQKASLHETMKHLLEHQGQA